MKTMLLPISFALTGVMFCAPAYSQKVTTKVAEEAQCAGPIYTQKDVSAKARITARPLPDYPEEARLNDISGRVVLTAVLCRSGQVTDIQVVKGLPRGVTEACIESARKIKFEAAEKDGEKVSVRLRVEHNFNVY